MTQQPNSFQRFTLAASLCAATIFAPLPALAQQAVVQDGIKVRPLSTSRIFAGGTDFNEQSKLQYAQLVNEAKAKNALVPDSDPQVKRLRAIAQRIIPFATRWNEAAASWNWQINLLNSDQVNAFCMPGGQIAFYSGIITKLNLTDDEVAVVMGHEISHALREHSREQASRQQTTGIFAGILGAVGQAYGITAANEIASLGADVGFNLPFSRTHETEADLLGMELAARAGYNPDAASSLWDKMLSSGNAGTPQFLSSHPSPENRKATLQANAVKVRDLYNASAKK